MTLKKILLFTLLAAPFSNGWAQIEDVIHQTFPVTDTIQTIDISIVDSVEVEIWGGNKIMTETSILLEGAKRGYLEHFIKNERYKISSTLEDQTLELSSMFPVKKEIKFNNNAVFELIRVRIFVPEEFKFDDQPRRLVRRD